MGDKKQQDFLHSLRYTSIPVYDVLRHIEHLFHMLLGTDPHICYLNKLYLVYSRYLLHILVCIQDTDLQNILVDTCKMQLNVFLYKLHLVHKVRDCMDSFHLRLVL